MELPDIDFKEDKEKYQAFEVVTDLSFKGCKHKEVELNDTRTELKCKCGASWTGPQLGELKRLLTLDKID